MKNTPPFNRKKRNYIKTIIEDAGCIDIGVLLECVNEKLNSNKENEGRIREEYSFLSDEAILHSIREYILDNDLCFAEKYGLEEVLKWEHLQPMN